MVIHHSQEVFIVVIVVVVGSATIRPSSTGTPLMTVVWLLSFVIVVSFQYDGGVLEELELTRQQCTS